jgi:hypothetical protein
MERASHHARSDAVMRCAGDACVAGTRASRRPNVDLTLQGYPDRGSEYDITVERRQLGKAGDSLIIRQGQDVVAISTEQARRLVQAIVEACR